SVYPPSLDFESNKSEMTLYLSNSGAGTLTWNITNDESWISYSPNSGTTTTEIEEIKVTVDRLGLNPGVHTGNILVSSYGGNQTIAVSLTVPDEPLLLISPQTLDFGGSKNTMTFDIANSGTGDLTWSLSDNQEWISANPTSGTNFGTINVSVDRSGLSIGSYSGQISITSNGGNGNVIIQMKKSPPNNPPIASFIVEPISGELSTNFTVDASGSSDDNTTISNLQVRWKWETSSDFTDWTTSKTATHQYSTTGTKKITLEVKDEEGATGLAEATVTVIEQIKPPVACFTISPSSGYKYTIFTFDASCSSNPGGGSLEYRWDFENDGTWDTVYSLNKTITHYYSQAGTYTICLMVKNSSGLTGTTTKDIIVNNFEGTYYFSDYFENGLDNWVISGQDWNITSTTYHSGSYCITDSPSGNYPPNANSIIFMKNSIDLSTSTHPVLIFWHKYSTSYNWNVSSWDPCIVDISIDGGWNWSELARWGGYLSTWNYVQIDLTNYINSNVKIRFRLTSDGRYEDDGWYIDDVEIKEFE
ncbi:MAG: PKD domain-containing protein, partial [Candidatus Marinimicrobia bacterium]|nr:PKD domain-containing protein [Candidatus Neomarinimicrobiota bacterium]